MEFDPLPPKNPSAKPAPSNTESSEPPAPAGGAAGLDGSTARESRGAAPRIDPLAAGGGSSGAVPPPMGSGAVAVDGDDGGGGGKSRGRRIRTFVVYPMITAMLAAAAGVGVAASIKRPEVAEIDSFVPRLVTELYDRNGEVLARYSRENRILLRDGEVPLLVQQSMIATEDANFMQHGGVDLKGVMRAMV
ncbi:MAG: transglycosylase domain-containing protein, partial [Acidobacteriota bacterium]